jgi:hypothetical protein
MSENHTWLTGDYYVVPVASERQAQLLQRLKRGKVQEVDAAAAKLMTGNAPLPEVSHYYVVRVGYAGDALAGTIPPGLSMTADVDAQGVAYVSSFALSRSDKTTELAAILASPTPLLRVVSTCGAAE